LRVPEVLAGEVLDGFAGFGSGCGAGDTCGLGSIKKRARREIICL
jgi:hypothetical protein